MSDLPPLQCHFLLNSQKIGSLVCDGKSYAAFSGLGEAVDNPSMTNVPKRGPIPQGRYFIIARQHGGRLGWLREWIHNHTNSSNNSFWFALWADDGKVDDYTMVKGVKRGNFRLHPNGSLGISEGCITLYSMQDFFALRDRLLASRKAFIPGTTIEYYGTVEVK